MVRSRAATINVRIDQALKDRIDAACAAESGTAPFEVTITALVERGIVLALDELDDIKEGMES